MALLSEILYSNRPWKTRSNEELAQNVNPQLPTMKQRLAMPTRSWQTRMSEQIQDPNSQLGLLGDAGNWVSGLTGLAKGALGMYGALKDDEAQKAYSQQMADLAEREYQDKLAQQQTENAFKEKQLAQQAELEGNRLANQKEIAGMNIKADTAKQALARQYALADQEAKNAHEQALYERGLLEQGIDPQLYGKDEQYTALINEGKKQQALQDQINQANIELGKSGKVGMDKVQQVIADPSRKIIYDKGAVPTKFFGRDEYRLSEPMDYTPAQSLSAITQGYKNPQPVQQSVVPNKKLNLNDLWGK